MDTLLDADTIDEATEAIRRVYSHAIEIAAPRIWRRISSLMALVAAGDEMEQTISDDEWELLISDSEDAVGDAVLDGAIAAAITVGVLAPPGILAAKIIEHITTLSGHSPHMREKIDRWIETTISKDAPADLEALVELLRTDSPLSTDKADLVAGTETQAAGNGGFAVGLDAAPPAAVRWVSQRDTRVRFAHAVADSETVPYGTPFIIGGYPAWYPGDPNLPFELRVNCRCELAIVEGTEVRRALGATKAELRTKAKELDISGRGSMNKGQLQHAILKALCMQGLAGGPDCPDKLDQMNRTALLTLARGQGIANRHRMSRPQLLSALRGELRGTDRGRVAAGYSTHQQFNRALKRATTKRRRLPDQDGSGRIPALAARRSARRAVFDEFDEGEGFVPCVHCGLRLHYDQREGLAMLVPEPIVPWSEGGTLDVTNLLPACVSCFRARGGRGLVAAADVPRDAHGKWCKGAQCNATAHQVITPKDGIGKDDQTAHFKAVSFEPDYGADENRVWALEDRMSGTQKDAWESYTQGEHHDMNRHLRYGDPVSDQTVQRSEVLTGMFATHGTPTPHERLYRGQAHGRRAAFEFAVGDEYVDNGFGSWSSEPGIARGFALGGNREDGMPQPSIITAITNAKGRRTLPGMIDEGESILPPGTRYRVTGIVDWRSPYDPTYRHRYMEVEVL